MTTSEVATAAEGAAQPRRWTPRIILAVVLLLAAGVVSGVVFGGGTGSGTTDAQLSEFRQACTEWVAAASDRSAPPSGWCTNMVGWMSDRMDGHPGMWASPAALRATCRQWAASSPFMTGSEANSTLWCDDMVSFMEQHATRWGSWNGSMVQGPMTG